MHRTVALVAAVALAACNRGDDPTVTAGATTPGASSGPTTATSSPPPAATPVAPPIAAQAPAGAGRAYLTAVRVAAGAGGGSRVVFEFEPGLPGYTIDYVGRPVTEDGSGDEVTLAGDAVLQVRFEDASGARIEGEKVTVTYKGPKRVPSSGTAGVVTEAVDAGDFEGFVTWAVGLRTEVPALTVTTLAGPPRLVIDVPTPPP